MRGKDNTSKLPYLVDALIEYEVKLANGEPSKCWANYYPEKQQLFQANGATTLYRCLDLGKTWRDKRDKIFSGAQAIGHIEQETYFKGKNFRDINKTGNGIVGDSFSCNLDSLMFSYRLMSDLDNVPSGVVVFAVVPKEDCFGADLRGLSAWNEVNVFTRVNHADIKGAFYGDPSNEQFTKNPFYNPNRFVYDNKIKRLSVLEQAFGSRKTNDKLPDYIGSIVDSGAQETNVPQTP